MAAAQKMEFSEAAARRLTCISSHLAAVPQNSCTSSVSSMVCSSSSGMQSSSRKDGRVLFARQDSSHLPVYAREFRECQGSNASLVSGGYGRRENRLLFARQACHTQAYFMRERSEYQLSCPKEKEGILLEQSPSAVEDPHESKAELPTLSDKSSLDTLNAEPLFARVVKEGDNKRGTAESAPHVLPATDAKHRVLNWLPRMDVAESRASYVVTVELPGVQVDGIRVEVNQHRLLISGLRSPECWMDCTEKNENAFYHKKELSQGPFEALWPMPKHIDLDSVSAEFMDGFLRILLPKSAA